MAENYVPLFPIKSHPTPPPPSEDEKLLDYYRREQPRFYALLLRGAKYPPLAHFPERFMR